MKHYVEKVQQPEFAAINKGYTFSSHQQEVGTGYFDKVTTIIQGGFVSDRTDGVDGRTAIVIFIGQSAGCRCCGAHHEA